MKHFIWIFISALCLGLVACGGGSDKGSPENETPVAPVLAPIGDQTVDVGDALTLTLSASDANATDSLSFSMSPVLNYAVITNNNDRTASLELTPNAENAGTLSITVTVTDSGTPVSTDEETFTLTIVDPNGPSVSGIVKDSATLNPIANALVTLQSTTTQTTTANDGSFRLYIPDGTDFKLVGALKGYYNAPVIADSPATDIEIQLTPVTIGTNPNYSFVEPDTCGSCHPDQKSEWDNTPMSNAGTNTWVHDIYDGNGTAGGNGGFVYTRDSVYAGSNPDSECASCHQPELWVSAGFSGRMEGPNDGGYPSAATGHGISCDICHKIADVDKQKISFPGLFPNAMTINLPDSGNQVEYGFLPDADFNVAGTMEPSYQPQLAAEVCGTCHQDNNDIDEDHTFSGITSEPTFVEWDESLYSDPTSIFYKTCIDCHMPASGNTEICSLFPPVVRDPSTVRTHTIEGTTATYLENAVELSMQTQMTGSELQVDVTIDNSLTGHHVPTGVTVRNMILLVEAWADGEDPVSNPLAHTGTETVHELGGVGDPAQGYYAGLPGKFYAKVNHDASGQGPTFFTDATGILFDNRIPALGSDLTNYTFDVPVGTNTVHVRARLIYRRAFRFLVDAKNWTEDGHGNPLEDIASPNFGHLMEIATADVITANAATLTVTVNGTPTPGAVTSTTPGIDCPGTCAVDLAVNSIITLTANTLAGYAFNGWSGACTGMNTSCDLTMTSNLSVSANYIVTPVNYTLTVTGNAGGTVTDSNSPAGINCGSDCSEVYADGSTVTLAASPAMGYQFDSWSGDVCSGSTHSTCEFTITADTSVTPIFSTITVASCANKGVIYDENGANGYGRQMMINEGVVSNPTDLAFIPGSTSNFVVTGQSGTVHYFDGGCEAVNSIDISCTGCDGIGVVNGGEQGLLNIEFHPDYGSSNYYVFFYHTTTSSAVNSVSRMTVSFDGSGNLELTDPVKIIDFRKPNSAGNHNGGGLVFAPDDTLLASVGDGGSGGSGNAQINTNLMGSVIRIIPSLTVATGGYSIPSNNTYSAGNPLCSDVATSSDPCPEILAIGLRNPYRMSIDGNIVYLGDVGSSYEEINSFDYTNSNLNFGWVTYDGPAGQSGFRDPILAYRRNDSTANQFRSEDPACNNCATGYASVIIGDVYHGSGYGGELTGRLLHAEFMDAYMRGVSVNSTGDTTDNGMHIIHHDGISAMVEGADGYIYIATQRGAWGTGDADIVYRLVKP